MYIYTIYASPECLPSDFTFSMPFAFCVVCLLGLCIFIVLIVIGLEYSFYHKKQVQHDFPHGFSSRAY